MSRLQASDDAGGESRLAGIEMALLTLRLLEHWRHEAGDYNSAMVLLSVVAIRAEKLTRSPLDAELRSLQEPLPEDRMSSCNISSIAAAAGFNRETARRYVNQLVEAGFLERAEDGSVALAPGYAQRPELSELLQVQLDVFARSANELVRLGALQWVADAAT